MVLLSLNSFSQEDQNYYGEWGIGSYDTLTDYTSILWDILPVPSLHNMSDTEIDIGFPFPYFDEIYDKLTINGQGYVFFGYNWYEIYVYAAMYEKHRTMPIKPDWRYRLDTVGMDILKFEWRNIGIVYDINSPSPTNHRLNFQLWLYENGTIEYRFGEMDLQNTPWFSLENGVTMPDGATIGPWVSIKKRWIEQEYFFLCNNDSIEFLYGGALSGDIYHCVPKYGTYMKFIPNEVVNVKHQNLAAPSFRITPNPVEDQFRLGIAHPEDPAFNNPILEIYNETGIKVFSKSISIRDNIDVSSLPAGFYTVSLVDKSGVARNVKMVKK